MTPVVRELLHFFVDRVISVCEWIARLLQDAMLEDVKPTISDSYVVSPMYALISNVRRMIE